ncbi:hypothetical protein [Actinopolymorpha rutila]|uniref:hypothetical protein n=1 Tax=Actinopolymorpha rutila TaxID=446787 RepID=UPI0031D94367
MAVSDADPRDPAVLHRIYALRGEVRRRDARPNDGRCGNVTSALAEEFGWQGQWGYLRLLDDTVSWVHCWNLLPDGTIVDATADQFQNLWLGDVVTVAPSSPMAANYLHAPKEWELRFERPPRAEDACTVRCVSGDEVHLRTPDLPERPWWSLARGVLEVITGWEVDDTLVDLAARVLRAKSATDEGMPSAELTHPLLIASIQHLGAQGTRPWIAPEFREPV